MKKINKRICLALALALSLSAFAGCGEKVSDNSENVEIKYTMAGPGIQEDSEKVWEAFNTELQKKLPGVNVKFDVYPANEYQQQFMLMLASGEKNDIANTYCLNTQSLVTNKTLACLNDLFDKYAKETKEALPEWFMEYGKFGEDLYFVPSYQMCASCWNMYFPKEYAEKYLDLEGLRKALDSSYDNISNEVLDILEDYARKVKASGVKSLGLAWPTEFGHENISYPFVINYYDDSYKVENFFASERYQNIRKRWAQWKEDGLVASSVLADASEKKGIEGGYIFWTDPGTPFSADELNKTYEQPVIGVPIQTGEHYYIQHSNGAGGTAILESCENKDKAMQVINLLQTDKDLHNLLVFGIEGDHYEKIGENQIRTEYVGQGTSSDRYGLWKWIVGNTELSYNIETEPAEYNDWVFNEVNASKDVSKIIGFKLNTKEIENELAQVSSIISEYNQDSEIPPASQPDPRYKEWMEKFEVAGNQKCIDEIQKQVDEFLASKNK